jgi:hypothetical protein
MWAGDYAQGDALEEPSVSRRKIVKLDELRKRVSQYLSELRNGKPLVNAEKLGRS